MLSDRSEQEPRSANARESKTIPRAGRSKTFPEVRIRLLSRKKAKGVIRIVTLRKEEHHGLVSRAVDRGRTAIVRGAGLPPRPRSCSTSWVLGSLLDHTLAELVLKLRFFQQTGLPSFCGFCEDGSVQKTRCPHQDGALTDDLPGCHPAPQDLPQTRRFAPPSPSLGDSLHRGLPDASRHDVGFPGRRLDPHRGPPSCPDQSVLRPRLLEADRSAGALGAALIDLEAQRDGLFIFDVDQTYCTQQGQRGENTFSCGNYRKRPRKSNRKQKKTARRAGHCFVMGLLITPSGIRIPFSTSFYTKDYCQKKRLDFRTQAELGAQLIRQLPVPEGRG